MLDRIANRIIQTTKMAVGRLRRWLNTRHLHGPKKVYLSDTQVMVTLLARNSAYFIRNYLDYYFTLGVRHILVIDNGSIDETIAICKTYDRVTVLQNLLPAKYHESGFRDEFSQRVAKGGWVLFADSDELIELPINSENALARLTGYCNQRGYTAVLGQMLDHFSLRPYDDVRGLSYSEAIPALDHYSLNQVKTIPYSDSDAVTFSWFMRRNKCVDPGVNFYRGGIRNEIFGENPFLSKHSLVRNLRGTVLMAHPHCASNVVLADFTLLIHHYKLAGSWVERDLGTVSERRWEHKEDTRRLSIIREDGSVAPLAPLAPQLWRGMATMRQQGFIYASDAFQAAMKDHRVDGGFVPVRHEGQWPNMRWAIVAPFFADNDPAAVPPSVWIDDFDQSGRHEYLKLPAIRAGKPESWHIRKRRSTPFAIWIRHWRQSRRGLQADCTGLVTVFPQLALTAAIQKVFSGRARKKPLLAWCFNVGERPPWPSPLLARIFLRQVDQFVVHSRGEIATLHRWFGIPRHKIAFVPLQRAPIALTASEDIADPFVLAMGSANRDYATLVEAIRGLPLRLVLVAAPRSLGGLDIPANVEVVNGLTAQQCRELAQRARINIVPLADVDTASGQVTIVEALRMGRPLIATRGVGSVDYIVDGENALLVEARDVAGLRAAITLLWDDHGLRDQLSRNALVYATRNLSDEMAAGKLAELLDKLTPL